MRLYIGRETKIHWTAYCECGRRNDLCTYREIEIERKQEVEGWSVCDLSSWANPEYPYYRIEENGRAARCFLYRVRHLLCIILLCIIRGVFHDSKMRRSDILWLLQKGKQDRKWADYRARVQSRQRQVECTRKNLSWNSFLRTITPPDRALLPPNCFSNGKLLKSNIISEFTNVRL